MEYEDHQGYNKLKQVSRPVQIRDRFLDQPKRNTVINEDDVVNLRIALETMAVEEFLKTL
jgi:hypothetical protein